MITYDRLKQIIPQDQALANKALATSWQQISGISIIPLPTFAETVSVMETTQDLPIIQAQTTAVPPADAQFYLSLLAKGSGPNGTITVEDILGTAAGVVSTKSLTETTAIMSTMNTTYLQTVYLTMYKVINGDYTTTIDPGPPPVVQVIIPPGTPGAGTYDTIDEAILALIVIAEAEMTNLRNAYPQQTATLNSDWQAMATQYSNEQANQASANLVFADLIPNERNSIYGLIYSLPGYGLDAEPGGAGPFIKKLAQKNTQYGQAIIGTLREGPDEQALNAAGITTNGHIPL